MLKYKVIFDTTVIIFTISLLAWIPYTQTSKAAELPDTLKADVYFAFNFVPKFKYEECVAFVSMSETTSNNGLQNYFGYLRDYLMEHEPQAFFVSARNIPERNREQYKILFANDCHRRNDILTDVRGVFLSKYPTAKIEISQKFASSTLDPVSGPFWINSNDYDPEHWRLKNLAIGTCDPERWQALAIYLDQEKFESNEFMSVYLYLSTAQALGNNSQALIERLQQLHDVHGIRNNGGYQKMISEFMRITKC